MTPTVPQPAATSSYTPPASTPAVSTPSGSTAGTETDTVKALQKSLQEAQKQAYERELELKKLRGLLKDQNTEPEKTPWVNVNITGPTPPDKNAIQPAVANPGPLQTSIQYYRHEYLLKPGDKLAINFIGEDPNRVTTRDNAQQDINSQFLQSVTVLSDGTIVLPPFGILPVAGRSLKQVNDELNQKITNFYRFAVITVSLAEAAPDTILVLGQVQKQGYVKVPVGTTVSQLLKEIDGVSQRGDLSHIFIRKGLDGTVYMADLAAFIEQGDIGQDMIVQTGDIVVVPEAQTEISYEKFKNTPFLPKEFQVKVLGAVGKPNTLMVKPGDEISTAIAQAGGIIQNAHGNKIVLFREDPATKSVKTIELKIKEVLDPKRNAEVDVALRPNDLIYVHDISLKRRALITFFAQTLPNSISMFATQSLLQNLITQPFQQKLIDESRARNN